MECIVLLVTKVPHIRVARPLRPFFLVDNHYSAGMRRVLRQILRSFWPITDMCLLYFFFIFMFSIVGLVFCVHCMLATFKPPPHPPTSPNPNLRFYAFSSNDRDPNFSTLHNSFISLFVLMTTANYPDVMMPALEESRFTFLFFLSYLTFGLYFLSNLVLAVVYDSFRNEQRLKFRKRFLHRRSALRQAFRLLKDQQLGGITFDDFWFLMRCRSPKRDPLSVLLFFKALNMKTETGVVNLSVGAGGGLAPVGVTTTS